jgi:succinate dehydrogenase/fumarate reductase flavoprotein subunit
MKKEKKDSDLTRRRFLEGISTFAAGAAFSGLAACQSTDSDNDNEPKDGYLPSEWAHETDILIVGLGGAGITAAITAAVEKLGDTLVIEAAPKGFEGGNTRVSQQVIFCGKDKKGLIEYQKNLNSEYAVDEARLDSWATELIENIEWLKSIGSNPEPTAAYSPEFAELKGSESAQCYLCDSTLGNQSLWTPLKNKFDELACTVLYGTRATELIQNPITKEICGVTTEDGSNIKARKGVLLACGGFEWDQKLMDDYYPVGCGGMLGVGTPYNRGDGIRMAAKVGANLWHMNNYASSGFAFRVPYTDENANSLTLAFSMAGMKTKDYIYVGAQGKRFMLEELAGFTKHGKMNYNGTYVQAVDGFPTYAIFTQQLFDNGIFSKVEAYIWANVHQLLKPETELLASGIIVKGDTIEELAEKINIAPANLKETIETYNGYCVAGKDLEFGRGKDVYLDFRMVSVDNSTTDQSGKPAIAAFELMPLYAPFYAVEIQRCGPNSQGGPERGPSQEVLRIDGTSIPRLYAGGECGSIYPYMYNGGGNVAEALGSGRLAVRTISKLESWEIV